MDAQHGGKRGEMVGRDKGWEILTGDVTEIRSPMNVAARCGGACWRGRGRRRAPRPPRLMYAVRNGNCVGRSAFPSAQNSLGPENCEAARDVAAIPPHVW